MTERRVRIVLDSTGAEKNAKNFESAMVGAGAASDKAAFSVNKLAAAIGGLITIQQVTRFVKDSIQTFAQFEQSMARVRAITRATDEQFSQMNATARELGATTEFTASQAAEGLQFLGMAGFSAADAIQSLPDVLNLATAASIGLGRSADITSNIMSAFAIDARDAGDVADVLAATSSRANTDVDQLGQAMSFVGPVAQSLGVSINDTAAAVGSLSDAGIQGGRAGTGLRRVMTSLLNPTGKAAKTIQSLGLTLQEVNPQTNDLVDIIGRLRGAAISGSEAMTIFGDRGGPALLALVEQHPRLVELTEGLQDVDEEALRMAETMRDTLTGDIKTLESAFQDLQITLVSTFDESLRNNVKNTTNVIRLLSENLHTIGEVIEILSVAVGTRLAIALAAASLAFVKKQAAALQATRTMNAYGAVVARTTVTQNALNASLTAGGRLIGIMGGPIGVVAIAAATFLTYRNNVDDAKNATRLLAEEVNNLTRAQVQNKLPQFTEELEKQEDELKDLKDGLKSSWEDFERFGSGMDKNTKAQKRASDSIKQYRVDIEETEGRVAGLTEKIEKLNTILAGGDEFGFMPGEDPFETDSATDRFQADTGPIDDSPARASNETELAEMQSGTEQLRRQLDARLKISQNYRDANLENIRNSFELEREENRIQEEERKINLDVEFENDRSKRQLRFEEKLEKMQLEFEQEQALRDEFKEQEKLRDEIHEEQKTAIEEKASRDREKIAQREKDTKIGVFSSLATAGLSILQAFGTKSVKLQKVFAIVESGIAITAGVAKALNNPYPANLGFAAQVAAQGATLISKLKSIGSGSGSSASVTAPPASAGSNGGGADLGRSSISDTSSARTDSTLRVTGIDDSSVLMGKTFKEIMKVLEDGGGFGRVVYGN